VDWRGAKRLLAGERLPAVLVDLGALDRNVDRVRERVEAAGKTLRPASKSVRHVGLLRRIMARGGHAFQGLMCFSTEEAVFLAERGFDDLYVAYPTVQPGALRALAAVVAGGTRARIVADCPAHLEAIAAAGRAAGVTLEAVLELDVSLRRAGGAVHLGARRSPIRTPKAALALARSAEGIDGVRITGLMGYEGHVAGVPDVGPFKAWMNPFKRWMKRQARPDIAALRQETVAGLKAAGVALSLVNGGGTGSLGSSLDEDCLTEVTAGSGFLCSHLFSGFEGLDFEPAFWLALEVSRVSDPGYVTCGGGGYIASGEPGWDRLPVPVAPPGLAYVSMEGAGEVQTPLTVPAGVTLSLGEPVLFRFSKAGEPAERFAEYLLVRDGSIEAREPTYRGEGACFL